MISVSQTQGNEQWLRAWVPCQVLPLTSCVTLSSLLLRTSVSPSVDGAAALERECLRRLTGAVMGPSVSEGSW